MVPRHLESSFDLLCRAYPAGFPPDDYWAVAETLYHHLADENVAILLAEFTGRDPGIIANEVLAAGRGGHATRADLERVLARLRQAGFDTWVVEE